MLQKNDIAHLARFQRRRRIALFAAICVGFAGLAVVTPAWSSPTAVQAVRIAGILIVSAGLFGRLWCTLYIGGRKSCELVSVGPYSVTRNPLYAFSALAALGAGALSGSISIALGFAAGTTTAFLIVIRVEEDFLRSRFGMAYEAYRRTVPRLLPDPRLFRDCERVEVRPPHLYRTLGDGIVFFAALPAFLLIAHLQAAGVLPILLSLY